MPLMPSSESRNGPIAFLDSGIGGIPYLVKLRKKLPRENYLYLADHANFPYGEKPVEKIREAVLQTTDRLLSFSRPKMIVLACNTASVSALQNLRDHVDIPVVGVVPAVKPAAHLSGERTIGVLATESTVNAPYLDSLIEQFARDFRVVRVAAGDIVAFVENRLLQSTREEQNRLVAPAIETFRRERADAVVLGCTHFTFLEENIRVLAGGAFLTVDSREGVANQSVRVLEKEGLLREEGEGSALFYTTGSRDDDYYHRIGDRFFLDFRGEAP